MKILMVCLGNICRSPVAEGILKHKALQAGLTIIVDSAGTSGWHDGSAPDVRSQKSTLKHGINISRQQSRKVNSIDFETFDLIYAMDENNLKELQKMSSSKNKHKLKLILNEIYPNKNQSVPDPYFTTDGFDEVFEMLNDACDKIIHNLKV